MKTRIVTLLTLLLTSTLFAQNTEDYIKGSVINDANEPISFANILLYSLPDSNIAKVGYSNEDGTFKIYAPAPKQSYYLEVSYVGLTAFTSAVFSPQGGKDFGIIHLENQGTLEEVVVSTQRRMIEVQPDKTVFNIDKSINSAGSDAMKLLRKAPGVMVDNNDNIILLGKSGVLVYVDGRKTPMSGDDLANMLKNIPSEQIDAIEIITSPSAKYEAEGNAGIINIKLKKNENFGTNGSFTAGYSIGVFAKYRTGLSLNYRNNKINTFGSINANKGLWQNGTHIKRELNNQVFDNNTTLISDNQGISYKVGLDFFINKQNTFGVLVNGGFSTDLKNGNGMTLIYPTNNISALNYLKSQSHSDEKRTRNNVNLNYQFKKKSGVQLNIDLDYGQFLSDNTTNQPNKYFDSDEATLLSKNENKTITPSDISLLVGKVDYEQKLFGGKIELGTKLSKVKTDNTFDYYNIEQQVPSLDSNRTNKFIYNENVLAGYISFMRPINKKLNFNIGLRAENTQTKGELIALKNNQDKPDEREYISWFPSGAISYTANPKNSFRLSYGKRVTRPNYQELNPFEFKLDELTYQKGNPFLQPHFSHNVQLSHTFMNMMTTSLGYTHIKDNMTRIVDTINTNSSFITWRNISSQDVYSLNISSPIPIKKWWSAYTNINFYQSINKADFGENRKINLKVTGVNIYAQNTFTLPKGMSLELSGFFASPSVWGGTFKTKSMWGTDIGLQKKILKGNGTLKIGLDDIFSTQHWRAESIFAGQRMSGGGNWEAHRYKINFSYNFGNKKVKSARRRRTGSEDEADRIKS